MPLRVADIMTCYVEFLPADATVQQAAEMMGDLDVGALPIGGEAQLDGIITDRDILYRVVAAALSPAATQVSQVMTRSVLGCAPADSVQFVLDRMASYHIRRMPVLAESGLVVGWLTLSDLSRRLLIDSRKLQDGLRDLTEA